MIRIEKLSLFLIAAVFVLGAVAEDKTVDEKDFTDGKDVFEGCSSICGETEDGEAVALLTPDLVVEYNWDPRVPTCAGKSCQTATCSAFDAKLSYIQKENVNCKQHQDGFQAAGCECDSGGSSPLFDSLPWWIAMATCVSILNSLLV